MVNTTHDFLAFAVSNCNLEESALGEITCIILSFRSIIQVDDHKKKYIKIDKNIGSRGSRTVDISVKVQKRFPGLRK